MTQSLFELKNQLRSQIRTKRSNLTPSERRELSEACCHESIAYFVSTEPLPQTICTYMPFGSEMDVTPVMQWCWEQGIRVVVPKVVQSTSQMKLYYINNYDDVELGAYGIREPKESNSELTDLSLIDVILVPGVAFDRQGGRLGMGGGYYDRFMDKLLLLENMPSCIALCFQSQVVDHVPSEPHDLRVDVILTEKGILRLQG